MSSFRTDANAAAQALLNDETLSRSTLWTHFVAEFTQAPGLFPVGVTEVPHEMVCVPAKALSRAAGNVSGCDVSPWGFDAAHTSSVEDAPEPEDGPELDQEALNEASLTGLRAWALQLRRTGFPATELPRAAEIYIDVINELIGRHLGDETADAIRRGANTMKEAIEQADLDGVPPASAAQVMAVAEASASSGSPSAADTRIVRLETSTPLEYAAGQVIPVMQADRQGVWNSLAPALPPNELGQVEFHVRDELEVEVGDHVTLGTAYGPVPFPEDSTSLSERVLLIADGTGLAAAKAMVFELMDRPERPQVELMIGVEHEDEFYDLQTFASLASSAAARDWLTVTCVAEQVMDPESSEAPAVCEGLRRVWAPLEHLAAATGTWWSRRLILCGSTARCTLLADALREAGAPAPLVIAPDAEPDWFCQRQL